MAEWTRTLTTTIAQYMRGVEARLTARQKVMAMLKKTGNIIYNSHGTKLSWAVEYNESPLTVNNGEQVIVPMRVDRYKRPELEWAGYVVADMMTKREKLINGEGRSQLINYWKEMVKTNTRNIERQFGEEFYVDSSASGNSGRLSGIETMMAVTGTVDLATATFASRSANAVDVCGYPDDTYAGLDTSPQAYGGSWVTSDITSAATAANTQWPAGKGRLSFDFFSPVICNYTSSTFSGSADTWRQQALEATRFLVVHMQRYDAGLTAVKKLFLERSLYRQFLDLQDSKEHMYVESDYSMRAMGFEDVFMQDGVEITWEWGIPSAVGYGFNFDNIELHSMQEQLFDAREVKFESLNNSYHFIVDFMGQIKFRTPKYFGKLAALA